MELWPPLPPPGSIPGYLHVQYGGRGRASSANHPPPPLSLSQHTQHSCKGTYSTYLQTTTHNRATTLVYIKLPMYLLYIWRLYLIVLRRATSLFGAMERVGPENLDFFGPKWHSLCLLPFQGPKKVLIFRAHPFQCPS
jgi:hypothetical protein